MKRTVLLLTILVSLALAQRDTLMRETFDGTWPPAGWRIGPAGASGVDAWHQEGAGAVPWSDNTSPYVALWYSGPEDHYDTLYSPIIDCSRWRNVDMRCSVYFRPYNPLPYTAQLLCSRDSGFTWTVEYDYFNDSVGPGLQVIDIDSAGRHPNVMLKWIWSGNLSSIYWWCIDNFSIIATRINDTDMTAGRMIAPRRHELPPGPITPQAVFRNRGLDDQVDIATTCEIWLGDSLAYEETYDIAGPLARGDTEVATYPDFAPDLDSVYTVLIYCDADGDMDRTNDTLRRTFTMSYFDHVVWDDTTNAGYEHWPRGGNSGWGLKVEPLAPARLVFTEFNLYVPSNNADRFRVRIVDSDGTDGAPGTVLYESPTRHGVTGWNTYTIPTAYLIVTQPFYVFYVQGGDYPLCPELCYDSARSANAEYWSLEEGVYAYDDDTTRGDWKIRCGLNYDITGRMVSDARSTFVSQPEDEITLRPSGVAFIPAARIDNAGLTPIANFAVRCTIYTTDPVPTPEYSSEKTVQLTLGLNEGTTVEFDSWVPQVSDCSVRVVVRTALVGDLGPDNDTISKALYIWRPHYTGGPEVMDRYKWVDSDTANGPVYQWIDTTGVWYWVITSNADIITAPCPMLMDFPYRSTSYNQVRISSSGWLTFDTLNAPYSTNDSIPKPAKPNLALYPFWDHLRAGAGPGSKVGFKHLGTEPNDSFVVTWHNMRFADSPGDTNLVSFQCIFQRATGNITFQYKDPVGGIASHSYGKSATVGIENASGNIGLQYLFGDGGTHGFWPANKLVAGRAITFYQVRRDVGVTTITEPKAFINPGPIHPKAKVKNYGSFVEPFLAYYRVLTPSGVTMYVDSQFVDGLGLQEERELTFGEWNAPFGNYYARCSTALLSDIDSTNNFRTMYFSVQAWLQKADIPRSWTNKRVKAGAATFHDSCVYALKGANTNEFWKYYTTNNTWVQLKDMPLGYRNKKNKDGGYLTTGGDLVYALKGGNTREFYAYNTASDSWTMSDSVPYAPSGSAKGARNGTCMTYGGNKVWLLYGNNTNDFAMFDIDLNKWTPKAPLTLGDMVRVRRGASIHYVSDTVLIAVIASNTSRVLRYHVNTNSWDTMYPVPRGPSNRKVKAGSCAAILDDTLYVVKGGNTFEFWGLDLKDPTAVWKRRIDVPTGPLNKKVKTGAALAAGKGQVYLLKGGNLQEFWNYGPGYDTVSFLLQDFPDDGVQSREGNLPLSFACAVAPNPFRANAAIKLALPTAVRGRAVVYDITGERVATLFDGALPAGRHTLNWNGRDRLGREVAHGVYVLRFESDAWRATRKLVLER